MSEHDDDDDSPAMAEESYERGFRAGYECGLATKPQAQADLQYKLWAMSEVVTNDELRLAEKHCGWPAFRHAFNAVMNARRASLDDGWRPFATAPKDGAFQVFLSKPCMGARIHTMRAGKGAVVAGHFLFDLEGKPTHWRPLPPEPKDADHDQ